jgi:ABC-2 type transport system ATP-binding protein
VSQPAVDVRGLTRVFAPRRRSDPPVTAIASLTFTVFPGAITALTGANGAGKTTLLDMLATVLLPTAGDAWICGASVLTAPAAVRRRIAYCPAGGASFYPRLTGRENLECFSALAGIDAAQRPGRLAAAADCVGVGPEVLAREVRTYSDGELQRLTLARAVMRDVDVWLLDEPTRSLDADGQRATWELIRATARERQVSVVVATHDAAGVAAHADAVVRL